ncbi:hypothetical protein B484DRAFT_449726 [Ochromonadaceae sp. CCMP2298]|nr:hypothetical protein B484DRAFT_449726 [Ochromonadaceae sp. CCMP2298]
MSKLQDDAWIISPHGKEAQDVAEQCTGCDSSFTVVVRRHLCCECNRIYCGRCSKIRTNAKNGSLVRRRVCMDCRPAVTPASSLSQRSTESELAYREGESRTVALVEIFDEERDVTNRQQQGQEQQGQEQGQAQTRPVLRQIDSNILSSLCDAGEDKVFSAQGGVRGLGVVAKTPVVDRSERAFTGDVTGNHTQGPQTQSKTQSKALGDGKATEAVERGEGGAVDSNCSTPIVPFDASALLSTPHSTPLTPLSPPSSKGAPFAHTGTLGVGLLVRMVELQRSASASTPAPQHKQSAVMSDMQTQTRRQVQVLVQTHAQTQTRPVDVLMPQFSAEADVGETWTDIADEAAAKTETEAAEERETEAEAEMESKEKVGASDVGSEQSFSMWSMLRCIVLLAVLVSWSVPHMPHMPHMLNMHSTLSTSDVRAGWIEFPQFPVNGSAVFTSGLEGVMTSLEAMGVGGMGMGKPPAQRAEFSTGLGAGSVGVGEILGVGMGAGVGAGVEPTKTEALAQGLSVAVTDVLVGGEADTPTSAPTSSPTPAWAGAWFSAHEQEHHLEPIPVSFKISFVGGRKSIGERLTGRLGNELNALGREIASAKRAVTRVWVQWGVRGDRYKKRNGGRDGGAASTAVGSSSQARHIPTPVM